MTSRKENYLENITLNYNNIAQLQPYLQQYINKCNSEYF